MTFEIKEINPELGFSLAGFADAEGSFNFSFLIQNKKTKRESWKIRPCFNICQKESEVLTYFSTLFGCGTLITNEKTKVTTFSVTSIKDLCEKIVPFFKRFPFESAKKKRDLSNFIQVLEILNKPGEVTRVDLERVLALRINTESIVRNRTYTDQYLIDNWPETIVVEEINKSPETTTPKSESVINTQNDMIESDLYRNVKAENALKFYIAGFADGDGSFNVGFRKREDYLTGWKITPSFSIAQRDQPLLNRFKDELECGNVRSGSSEGIFYLEVSNQKDLREKIIPFFQKYRLLSKMNKERFDNFSRTLEILGKAPTYSRLDLVEILQLQRTGGGKGRFTVEEILARFDDFSKKT